MFCSEVTSDSQPRASSQRAHRTGAQETNNLQHPGWAQAATEGEPDRVASRAARVFLAEAGSGVGLLCLDPLGTLLVGADRIRAATPFFGGGSCSFCLSVFKCSFRPSTQEQELVGLGRGKGTQGADQAGRLTSSTEADWGGRSLGGPGHGVALPAAGGGWALAQRGATQRKLVCDC